MDASAGTTGGGLSGFGGGSGGSQLSHLVPTYNPASDDLLIHSQKVELLAQAWPEERRPELVARLMLGCSGSAFHKLQLHREDLMTGDKDAVKRLITLLGGYWGKVPLEKRYELTGRALFRCIQKGDETHDSYLARSDIAWAEMLARKTTLAELQAYIILRGSQLSSEDKKRVILESDASGDGELTMDRVSKAVRMLGAGFFQEMVTGKRQTRSKTYDYSTAFTADDVEDEEPEILVTWTEEQEEEAFELLLSEGDDDAALIADYEAAVTDLVQQDPELAATYNAYAEARKRLNDKFKHRGFWPVRPGGKGKGGKGKGKGKDKGGRKSLQSRILSSNCRICGQRGHWKAECPLRHQGTSTSTSTTQPSSSFTGLAEAYGTDLSNELPSEFMEIPEVPEPGGEEPCREIQQHFALVLWGNDKNHGRGSSIQGVVELIKGTAAKTVATPGDRTVLRQWLRPRQPAEPPSRVSERKTLSEDTGSGACGIVDSGATKTVIGSAHVSRFLESLNPEHRSSLGRCPCQVIFRFGNQGTLESKQALVVSLGSLRLKIAVVPGRTPFLLSNTLLRTLHASIDTHAQVIRSPFMPKPVPLSLTSRGLFVLDMNALMSQMSEQVRGILPSTTYHTEAQEKTDGADETVSHELSDQVQEVGQPDVSLQGLRIESSDGSHGRCARPVEGPPPGGLPTGDSPEPVRDGCHEGGVRQGASGQDLQADLAGGAEMAELVPEHLRGLIAARPPTARPVCPDEVHRAGGGRELRSRSPSAKSGDHSRRDQESGPCEELHHQGGGELGDAGAGALPAHGGHGTDPAADPAHPAGALQHAVGRDLRAAAGDIDGDEVPEECLSAQSLPSREHVELSSLVNRYEAELRTSLRTQVTSGPQAQLFEVFCGSESQLTHQCVRQGMSSERFGLPSVDLTTTIGRQQLFNRVAVARPQHIWLAPECKYWCAWSELNARKSLDVWDRMTMNQNLSLQQVAVCLVLVRHQLTHGRHAHWEQPLRSRMFGIPGTELVTSHMSQAVFDMCRFGLCDPRSKLPIQKRMQVWTSDALLSQALHGMFCNHGVKHQVLEGQTKIGGVSMNRTKFSESYPRRFARWIAVMLKRSCQADIHVTRELATEASGMSKRLRRHEDAQVALRRYLEPTAVTRATEPEGKRRRLHGKQTDVFQACEDVVKTVNPRVPRVGKVEITDRAILDKLQGIMPEHTVVTAVACRGVDRTIGPPNSLRREDAPLRRSLMVLRVNGVIALEDMWEDWSRLPKGQVIRRNHACRLCITVFACPHETEPETAAERPAEREVGVRADCREPASESVETQESCDPRMHLDVGSPLQDSAFRSLHPCDRQWLLKAHRNLGHPNNEKLQQALRDQHMPEAMIEAAKALRCSTCEEVQRPKLARPATLKDHLDFNDRIAIDELIFTSQAGQRFHVFHVIDYCSSYHVAFCVPSPTSQEVIDGLTRHWLSWAGAPGELIVDAASEFTSEAFLSFLQSAGIRCTTIAPRAHWQSGKIERHGQTLEVMLRKYDIEHGISDSRDMSQALWHSCQAKNSLSLCRGFSPETIVLGKPIRVPGSTVSDTSVTAHALADAEGPAGVLFREQLARRETARRAFHEADNSAAIRRAILRRSRPQRAQYDPGEWVMMYKAHGNLANQGVWFGPLKVLHPGDKHQVWAMHGGKIYRGAPEHFRPVSAWEARQILERDQEELTAHPVGDRTHDIDTHRVPTSLTSEIPQLAEAERPSAISSTLEGRPTSAPGSEPDQECPPSGLSRAATPSIEREAVDTPLPADAAEGLLCADLHEFS